MKPSSSLSITFQLSMLLLLLLLSGCKGCTSNPLARKSKLPDIDELEKKKQEKPKEDYEFRGARVLPDEESETRAFVKPGHWITVRNLIRANNFDVQADLFTSSTDASGQPLRVENTDFQISSVRQVPLPKGMEKSIDTSYFVPLIPPASPTDQVPKTVWLTRELRLKGGRLMKEDIRQGTTPMPPYQYYFVTLVSDPERYAYLKSLPSFAAYTSQVGTDKLVYYRVVTPLIDNFAPLPNHALTWTSIAYLLWDDMAPNVLVDVQKQALLDWLHWGGQLIISGPNSLEKLRGSFLDPYLPAKPGNTVPVPAESLAEINRHWSLLEKDTGKRQTWDPPEDNSLMMVELEKQPNADYVPRTGQLLVERRVGTGRIVVSAFSLTDTRWLRWKALDNFMNGAILRRPARDFRSVDSLPDSYWADYRFDLALDPRLITTVRYFTRDIGIYSLTPGSNADWEPGEAPVVDPSPRGRRFVPPGVTDVEQSRTFPPRELGTEDWHFRGFPPRPNTSMAAWNDRSGPSEAAREALKDASGISVPRGDFVLKVLAIYLMVLAPLNWAVFRAIGRVEWAWVAAPVIAILGTFAVVRMAQLDIGFARSMTEVAVVEMQGEYNRAHVTRYTALYTSLSTSYDVEFSDDGSLAQPFAASVDRDPKLMRTAPHEVMMRRDRNVRLTGFLVNSNTEGFVHSEQIVDLGSGFSLVGGSDSELQIRNGTSLRLNSVGVLQRTPQGELRSAWIGDLPAKSTSPLRLAPVQQPYFNEWESTTVTSSYHRQVDKLLAELDENGNKEIERNEARGNPELNEQFAKLDEGANGKLDRSELARWMRQSRAGEVSLGVLTEMAAQRLALVPGDVRLIGWTSDEVPGVKVQPAASQELRRALFVVHLAMGALPEPRSDLRPPVDVVTVQPENEEP